VTPSVRSIPHQMTPTLVRPLEITHLRHWCLEWMCRQVYIHLTLIIP